MPTERDIYPDILLFSVMKILQELYGRKGYGDSEIGK